MTSSIVEVHRFKHLKCDSCRFIESDQVFIETFGSHNDGTVWRVDEPQPQQRR